MPNSVDEDLFGDEYNRAVEAYLKLKKLRKNFPWASDIIKVLWSYSSGTTFQRLSEELWTMRGPKGLPMPREFAKTIQSSLNQHTKQSSRCKNVEDQLFFSPKGKHSGTWAVDREKAAAWLKARRLPLP